MPFIVGTDTVNTALVGSGTPISKFEVKYYVNTDSAPTIWNPENVSSNFKRIVGVSNFTANAEADEIKYYDGFDELGAKMGRKTSTLEIVAENRGDNQSIKQYENDYAWYMEAIGDDRDLTNTDGTYKYQILKSYYGKLVKFSENKNDLYEITGSGSFDTTKTKTIYTGVTPVTVTIEGSDNTAGTGIAEVYDIAFADIYGTVIDASDLSADDLFGEILSCTIEKVSGTPTISVSDSVSDDQKSVVFTGTGSCVVRAKVVCKSSGVWYSANKTVTVS